MNAKLFLAGFCSLAAPCLFAINLTIQMHIKAIEMPLESIENICYISNLYNRSVICGETMMEYRGNISSWKLLEPLRNGKHPYKYETDSICSRYLEWNQTPSKSGTLDFFVTVSRNYKKDKQNYLKLEDCHTKWRP